MILLFSVVTHRYHLNIFASRRNMKIAEFKKAFKVLNELEQDYDEYSYFVKTPKNCICINQVLERIFANGEKHLKLKRNES